MKSPQSNPNIVLSPFSFGFGQVLPGRSINHNNPIDLYKFTGHSLSRLVGKRDAETCAERRRSIGRFLSVEPLASKYQSLSPFSYTGNNPINAIDPDGRLIVFINGQTLTNHGSYKYWGAFADAVKKKLKDDNAIYRDGSIGGWGNTLFVNPLFSNLIVSNRISRGYKKGMEDAETLLRGLEPEETVKIITHSMGGAYGKGYVKALQDYMKAHPEALRKITLVWDIDPLQAASLEANPDVYTIQASHFEIFRLGLADEIQKGHEKLIVERKKREHALQSFLTEVDKLIEVTYEYDATSGKYVCTSCKN